MNKSKTTTTITPHHNSATPFGRCLLIIIIWSSCCWSPQITEHRTQISLFSWISISLSFLLLYYTFLSLFLPLFQLLNFSSSETQGYTHSTTVPLLLLITDIDY